jgi:thiol-disulfide isomerase/thioredoxin
MKGFLVNLFIFSQLISFSNTLSGTLAGHAEQELTLYGYSHFKSIVLAKALLTQNGEFTLNYANDYKGMAYLQFSAKEQLYVILHQQNMKLTGTHLIEPNSIVFENSYDNTIFSNYGRVHSRSENILAGLKHVLPFYKDVVLLSPPNAFYLATLKEIDRLEKKDQEYIKQLHDTSYVKWFLPHRKLIGDISASVQKYPERIPEHIKQFREINFSHSNMVTSGLLANLIESHYWLLENSGKTLESMYAAMNKSTDALMASLQHYDELLNSTTNHLFDYLEKHSLLKASEYLALKMLTDNSCTLDNDLVKQLETYRIMKVGNKAPPIKAQGILLKNGKEIAENDNFEVLNNKITLVVFGSSWCETCRKEIPKLKNYYAAWQEKGVEVVFVSLDNEATAFNDFAKSFPWLSICDLQGWESPIVNNYYVFSTPTMFLLDNKQNILVRPISIEQVDAWVKHRIKNEE